jgi:tetraacyldisaccharide 4'-kinase
MAWIVPAHRRIVRNEAVGWGPAYVRALLRGLSLPYSAAVRCRRHAYRLGWLRSHSPKVPVVSIGNVTTGGVGKTPFVQAVVGWLAAAGHSPVVVSRGYKSNGAANDESLLLKENLPGVALLQNPDRVSAVHQIVEHRLGDVVVLDDGFQHLRLRRTIDLVLLDATDPFGCNRLLPAGFLREPISALAAANAVVLTRASLATLEERDSIRRQVAKSAPTALWAEIDFAPTAWSRFSVAAQPLDSLREKRVLAFCGIGNPEAFRLTLDELAMQTLAFEAFPDHHWFSPKDLAGLAAKARLMGADALVATQKDAVKIPQPDIDGVPLYSLRIETRFRCGEVALRQLVVDRVAAFEAG